MKWLGATAGLVVAAGLGFGGATFSVLLAGLPQVSGLEEFAPPSSTRVFAADGTVLAEFATERRTPVSLDRVPQDLVRAVLAIEDHRFYDHIGLNVGRIGKALVTDLARGRVVEGGSTITQQLAKVLFLTPERTVRRKVREALLALEIERCYTKDEILAFYLNQIYLGNRAYGVAAASRVYFGKAVEDLNLGECALLASLPKAPGAYDPFRHPDRARRRRDLVLRRMEDLGWAEPSRTAQARELPLPTGPPALPVVQAPYFVEKVRRELLEALGMDPVYQGGLRVYTTLDPALQRAAERSLATQLTRVEGRHKTRATPVQGAVIALDPNTGAVRAHVGGRDWAESGFDRAVQARRQPGSAFKPFVYLAALEAGWTQADPILDAPASYPGARRGHPWEPRNYDGAFLGPLTLRRALAKSRNLPAVRLLERVGRPQVENQARALGLTGPFGQGLAEALGVGSTTLLELTRAYGTIPAGGVLSTPHWIRAVYGPDGRNLWPRPPGPKRVLDPAVAYVLSDMLQAVVEGGTGRKAATLPFPVGGKTGTTDDQRDAWFVGFSSRLALGVWVGRDDNTPLGWAETGARAALPTWIDVMLASASAGPPPPWSVPPGVTFTEIDLASGLAAGPACKLTAPVAFARGTEPVRRCDREGLTGAFATTRIRLGHPLGEIVP